MLGALTTGVGAETLLWALHNAYVGPRLPQGPMVSFVPWTINLLIIVITQVATGWLIARTHRAHAIPALLTFLTFSSTWWIYQNFSLLSRLTVDSIDQPRFRIYLAYHLSTILVANLSVLLGGFLGASPKLPAAAQNEN
jgi:hypothetical protein